jgi:hypothetical protein
VKGEEADLEKFNGELQEVVFDFFNLITKEYYLTIDKF